jgi:solute carrier family 35 protein F1/2
VNSSDNIYNGSTGSPSNDEDDETIASGGMSSDDQKMNNEDPSNRVHRSNFLRYIPIHYSPFTYMVMALIDLEANYFTYLAYRYTTLPSVSLLDALALPSAMFFSFFILRRSYNFFHCVGAVVCLIGVALNVVSDYDDDGSIYPYELFGDGLAILGALLFGLSNTLTEKVVKQVGSNVEYMGMLGFFGSILALIQSLCLERSQWQKLVRSKSFHVDNQSDPYSLHCTQQKTLLLFTCCVLLSTTVYVCLSRFLITSEAAFFNLSMLTADFWAVFLGESLDDVVPSQLFWVALVLSILGVVIYEMGPSPSDSGSGETTECAAEDEEDVELTKISVSVIS